MGYTPKLGTTAHAVVRYLIGHTGWVAPTRIAREIGVCAETIWGCCDRALKAGYIKAKPHPTRKGTVLWSKGETALIATEAACQYDFLMVIRMWFPSHQLSPTPAKRANLFGDGKASTAWREQGIEEGKAWAIGNLGPLSARSGK